MPLYRGYTRRVDKLFAQQVETIHGKFDSSATAIIRYRFSSVAFSEIGKTNLLKNFMQRTNLKYRFDIRDALSIQNTLSTLQPEVLREYIQGYELVVVDEAQKIPKIGDALKIMVDIEPNIQIIATGSSSFELAEQTGKPLTRRKTTLNLYPISIFDLIKLNQINPFDLKHKLIKDYLIYGLYPETLQQKTKDDKKQYLRELVDSYLLKDILAFQKVRKSKVLLDLLRLIAFQIGSEVSTSEIGQKLGISSKTVKRYLNLLEESFVIFNLRGFSRNLRKEITKMSKYYFYDNGILNSIILNFNPIDIRNDVGQLWENFIIAERIKKQGK